MIRIKCNYHYLLIGQYLEDKRLEIESLGTHEDADEILKSLNNYINEAISQRNVSKDKCKRISNVNLMQKCNTAFQNYNAMIKSDVKPTPEVKEMGDKYNKMRNKVTFDILKQEHEEWKNLAANDARSLWEKLIGKDWLNLEYLPTILQLKTFPITLRRCTERMRNMKFMTLIN